MADKNPRRNPTTDALFDAILSLETRESEIKRNTFELYVQQVLGVDIESTEINLYYRRDWEKKFLDMTPNTIIGIAIDNRNSHFL